MKREAGNAHVLDGLRRVQGYELQPEAFGVTGLDSNSASGLKELSQALVPKRFDHESLYHVAHHATNDLARL